MLQVGCITRPNLLSQPGLRHRLRLPLPMRVREATSTTPKERTSFWPGAPCQMGIEDQLKKSKFLGRLPLHCLPFDFL